MAFLQRIINSGERGKWEMAVNKGRNDLEIYFSDDCFVLELKLYYDSHSEPEGQEQLAHYLDKLGEKHG
jgi:hypothetical protein